MTFAIITLLLYALGWFLDEITGSNLAYKQMLQREQIRHEMWEKSCSIHS